MFNMSYSYYFVTRFMLISIADKKRVLGNTNKNQDSKLHPQSDRNCADIENENWKRLQRKRLEGMYQNYQRDCLWKGCFFS